MDGQDKRTKRLVARGTAWLFAGCICLATGHAWAANAAKHRPPAHAAKPAATIPEAESEVYTVKKVRDEEKKVTGEVSEAAAEATSAHSLVDDAVAARDAVDHQARLFNDSAESQQLTADKDAYNASCAGKMLYGADIGRCDSWKASVLARMQAHDRTFLAYKAQFDALDARVRLLRNNAVLADAKITKLKNYLSWLTATDDRLATSLSHDCKGASGKTLEELKHRCGNIQFDGARADLPPCDTEMCRSFVLVMTPPRTPEQAIQDYKNSGKANPTPNPLLDKGKVPPPPRGSGTTK